MNEQQMGLARSMGLVNSGRVVGCARVACGALLACAALFACGEQVGADAATALEADTLEGALHGGQLAKRSDSAYEGGRHGTFRHRGRHHHRRERPPEEPTPAACDDALSLEPIAGGDGEWLIGTGAPALDNQGSLAFAATDAAGIVHLVLGDGGDISAVSLESSELGVPVAVALDDAGNLAFVAATAGSDRPLGVFATDTDGSELIVHYAAEEGGGLGDTGSIITGRPFALAPNGTLAFSSIRDGQGALYRGEVTGNVEVLQRGAGGTFFNPSHMAVNDAGTVALMMEHGGDCGLRRSVVLLDEPGTELGDLDKAIAGLFVGVQPDTALNDAGEIAFALTGTAPTVEMWRCPVGGPVERIDVATGVYTASRTPFTELPELELVADNADDFASFGSVDIDAEGRVVFEAELAAGGRGIFQGPDPVADKVVAVGDELDGEVITEVQLGQLNDSCQLSFATSSASGRRVWRANGVSH